MGGINKFDISVILWYCRIGKINKEDQEMKAINKITKECFATDKEYKKFLELVKIEKEKNKTHFNSHNLDASIVQHDFVNYEDY